MEILRCWWRRVAKLRVVVVLRSRGPEPTSSAKVWIPGDWADRIFLMDSGPEGPDRKEAILGQEQARLAI
jgi:hypothetical protein